MAGATAAITLSATCSGLIEGGLDQVSYQLTNTSAAASRSILSLTTLVGTATPVVMPSSGQFMIAISASTNTNPWFVTHDTAQTGIPISSNGIFFARMAGGSTVYFYVAAGSSAFALTVLTY